MSKYSFLGLIANIKLIYFIHLFMNMNVAHKMILHSGSEIFERFWQKINSWNEKNQFHNFLNISGSNFFPIWKILTIFSVICNLVSKFTGFFCPGLFKIFELALCFIRQTKIKTNGSVVICQTEGPIKWQIFGCQVDPRAREPIVPAGTI